MAASVKKKILAYDSNHKLKNISIKNYPVRNQQIKILSAIESNDAIVIVGNTGCGKSTQIPQMIYEAGLNKGYLIGCSQPRRVAAINLANYVEKEMKISGLVGYSVRFDKKIYENTVIKFITDGMLLRESMDKCNLDEYSFLIIDECHERSVASEINLAIIKQYMIERNAQIEKKTHSYSDMPKLKLIVMSATLNADVFSNYLWNAPVINVGGNLFDVKIFYSQFKIYDYLSSSIETIVRIHKNAPIRQNILCFLAGQEEIEIAEEVLTKNFLKSKILPTAKIIPLYANLSLDFQKKVFEVNETRRKIVLSTNIAESSLTIPDIVHVVDCGRVKMKEYSMKSSKNSNKSNIGIESLKLRMISKASAQQRSGRAGRMRNGFCYRIYSESQYEKFNDFVVPQIKRMPLENIFLQVLACGIEKLQDFEFLESPSVEKIQEAFFKLKRFELANFTSGIQKLTKLGNFCSLFPLSIELSLTIYYGMHYGCLQQILQIVSMIAHDSPLFIDSKSDKNEENVNNAKILIVSKYGDHMTYLNVFRYYRKYLMRKKTKNQQFNNGNKLLDLNINESHMKYSLKIYNQLLDIIKKNFPNHELSQNYTELHILKCFMYGFKNNILRLDPSGTFYTQQNSIDRKIYIHPQSTMFGSKSKYVIFGEIVETSKLYCKIVSYIDQDWLN